MSAEFVTVTKAEAGQKLVRFLERRVGSDIPRSAIMRWIRKGNVRVDKGRRKPFDLVKEGQMVRVPPYKGEENSEVKALPPLKILYEDDNYLAVYKPAGLPSQGGTGHSDSVADRLSSMYATSPFKPAPAHRLDRDTSGVLLAGKSHEGQKNLSEMFAGREGGKYYLVQVSGQWAQIGWQDLYDFMEKSGSAGQEKMITGQGKKAHSSVFPLEVNADKSTLLVKLHTGRTHQIRVQLASRNYPIVGDTKYGGIRGPMMLHCWRIETPWFVAECLPDWDVVLSEDLNAFLV